MRVYEHRSIGDAATGAALVNVGGGSPAEQLWLTFGDVVALSGDFFRPADAPLDRRAGKQPTTSDREASDRLFALARVPGRAGRRLDTRDEIICALKVTTVDESLVDPRFEPGGQFAEYRFSAGADRTAVERRVRDRYLTLAATNDDHFVTPGSSDVATGSGYRSAPSAYRHLHQRALREAWTSGRQEGDLTRAMAREAAAQHYLTDAFAAGHLRTPVADIRRYWSARYPRFWERLQSKVAADTATTLRELTVALRVLPARSLYRRTLSELTSRTRRYPKLSLGDLVARCFHDWDNTHGLSVQGGAMIFGDGAIELGLSKELALAAVRAGNDDVEVAFELGRAGRHHHGGALYDAVRRTTGGQRGAYLAESRIPRLSAANSPQNWRAPDAETLWDSPVVGTTGTSVGQALATMLEPGGQFMRQLDGLGQGLAGTRGVFAAPWLGGWLRERCALAFHDGFVKPLARNVQSVLFDLVGGAGTGSSMLDEERSPHASEPLVGSAPR
jgi:hypothetical protein